MSLDQPTAREIIARLDASHQQCVSCLNVIKRQESLGLVKAFGRLTGDFCGSVYTNVIAPLWALYPDLEPSEIKEKWVELQPTLSDESKRILRTFVDQTRQTLAYIESTIPPEEADSLLKFGKLSDIQDVVDSIERFLNEPWLRDAEQDAAANP